MQTHPDHFPPLQHAHGPVAPHLKDRVRKAVLQLREQDVTHLISNVPAVPPPRAERTPDLVYAFTALDEYTAWDVTAEVGRHLSTLLRNGVIDELQQLCG